MNKLAIIIIASAMQGCGSLSVYEQQALGNAQAATDTVTEKSEWWICEGRPIGQFQRDCTGNEKKCSATNDLCAARQPTWTRIGESKP